MAYDLEKKGRILYRSTSRNTIIQVIGRRQKIARIALPLIFVWIVLHRLLIFDIASISHLLHSPFSQGDRIQTFPLPHYYKGKFPSVAINRTLGFEKILVVSLAERLNKRDEMIMMADASDIDITFQDAIRGTSLQLKSVPAHDAALRGQELGCWRSHVNVWQRMIRENIQSALIMEDDIDWHQDIKEQLRMVQGPLATLSSSFRDDSKHRKPTVSHPYPGEWELLWLGACLEESWAQTGTHRFSDMTIDSNEPLVLYQDATLSNSSHWSKRYREVFSDYGLPLSADNATYRRKSIFNEQIQDPTQPHRIVQKALFPVCTASYAITLQGARKMLYYVTRAITRPIDHSMARLGYDDLLEAYSFVPALMGQWKIDHGWNSEISLTDDDATTGIEVNPSRGESENVGPGSIRKHIQGHYFGQPVSLQY